MSSTNDISHYIIQCTQEICNQIVYSHNSQEGDKAKSNPAQLFLKVSYCLHQYYAYAY